MSHYNMFMPYILVLKCFPEEAILMTSALTRQHILHTTVHKPYLYNISIMCKGDNLSDRYTLD